MDLLATCSIPHSYRRWTSIKEVIYCRLAFIQPPTSQFAPIWAPGYRIKAALRTSDTIDLTATCRIPKLHCRVVDTCKLGSIGNRDHSKNRFNALPFSSLADAVGEPIGPQK